MILTSIFVVPWLSCHVFHLFTFLCVECNFHQVTYAVLFSGFDFSSTPMLLESVLRPRAINSLWRSANVIPTANNSNNNSTTTTTTTTVYMYMPFGRFLEKSSRWRRRRRGAERSWALAWKRRLPPTDERSRPRKPQALWNCSR